jgi:hypothetical protein
MPLKLRLLTAIHEKLRTYKRYRTTGLLLSSDRDVIAVGGSAIRMARMVAGRFGAGPH